MLPRERLEVIKQIAINEKKVYVSKLSEQFDVTEETIRRDLEKLEQQGVLTRSYGGAILNTENIFEDLSFQKRVKKNIDCKQYIASKALEFINQGTTILADCSSTVLETLKLIKSRKDITVITNSIEVLQELSDAKLNIISTGGSVKQKSLSLQGPITQSTMKNYNVDVALISCKGIDMEKGILDSNEAEAENKRIMIKQASKTILLVDNTKFDKISFVKLFDYSNLYCVITDKKPTDEWIEFFNDQGVMLLY